MRIQGFTSYLGAWQAAPGPLYRRLAAAIAAAVASGRLPAGSRLPAERPLAAALAVSRTTVIGAYDVLREEGWVESRRGSGTRVRALPPELPAAGAAPPAAGRVLVPSGAQQAIGLVAALYPQPGDAVALEDPNYPGALDTFNYARARLVPIPVTADGANVERLREAVVREAPRLIYLVPSFHNPTGALMPETQRRALAHLAADTPTPVVEDLTLA